MPVDVIFVEGNLDSEVLAAVFKGTPVVRRGGSKNSLKPQARSERKSNRVIAGYIRDRDFDYEPPKNLDAAVVDSSYDGLPLGWRWARHEMENYLLDPAIVARATKFTAKQWSEVVTDVASRIRWYQVARWTIGQVRRDLPPHYQLATRPAQVKDLHLPDSTGEAFSRRWCSESIREFAERIESNMSIENVDKCLRNRSATLGEDVLSDIANVLVWCSGKDLLAGLSDESLKKTDCVNAGELRAVLRDWIRDNADEAIQCFSEWQSLVSQVRT